MEGIKDDKHISIGSSPQESELLNKEILITPIIYEANEQKITESENSTILAVQDINVGLSSDPSVSPENSNMRDKETSSSTAIQINDSRKIADGTSHPSPSDEFDHRKIGESSSMKALGSATSNEQSLSISLEDSNNSSSIVEDIVKDASQPLPSNELDCIQIEEGSSRKVVKSASSNKHLMSLSPDDSNKIDSSVEGIVKNASQPLPSDELDHSQIEEVLSQKTVESSNSDGQFVPIFPNDSNKSGSRVDVEVIVKDASQPLCSDEFDCSQIKDSSPKKSVESAASNEQLMSTSSEDSSKTGLIVEGVVKDAPLPSDNIDHTANSDDQVVSISTEDSNMTGSIVEGIVKHVSQPVTSDEFDHSQIEDSSPKKAVESATSNEQLMSISSEESNKTSLIVEGVVKDAPLSSDNLEHSQVERGSSKKAAESASSNEQDVPISTDDSNKTGSIVEGIVKDAPQPVTSDEFGHSQSEERSPKKIVESGISNEQLMSISSEDSNKTGLIVEGVVKDAPLSSDNLEHSQVEGGSSKKAAESASSNEQDVPISTDDSNKTGSIVEGIAKDAPQPVTSDEFGHSQNEERSPKKTVESGISNKPLMSISSEDSNTTGLIVEGINKDAPLPSDALDHSQAEEGSSKKAVESANSNEQVVSISTKDSNKMGSTIEGTVKDASQFLPSDELDHSQIEEVSSKNDVKSANSNEQMISISPEESNKTDSIVEGIVVKDVKVSDSVNISVEDLSKTATISGDVDMSPSHLKYKESSEYCTSGVDLDVRSNDHGNTINNIESIDDTRPSLRSDNSWAEEEGTKNRISSDKPSTQTNQANKNRGVVDTAAPFESVKDVVCKFGGITDWKAHRSQTKERQRRIQVELEKVLEEIPQYKKQADDAEDEKTRVLEELESVKRIIEELKLSLEKAETEEAQAKQDSELAQLRIKEMEQGIASESSVVAKEQLNVAKSRHAAAVAELESVKKELKNIQEEYGSLVIERDKAIKQAEEAISASKDVEKTVEDLTLELITAREALESAHAAHMEAEEHRIGATLARDNDSLNWQKELKQAEDEVRLLNEKLLSVKDLQSKLDVSTDLLNDLKIELAVYMEEKLKQESESLLENNFEVENVEAQKSRASMQDEVASTKKELEEVRGNIEKVKEELNHLKVSAASLKSELETEKAALATMRQREGMASITVSSLESELHKTKMEIELVQTKEKDVREKMVELPKVLQQAAQETDAAKLLAQTAQEEFKCAKEEAEQARGSKRTMTSRLNAALKEIEASRASERLAKAAIKALQESEQASEMGSLEGGSHAEVTLSLEEYYALSKEAHDAEERAGESVAAALSQIEVARESETRSLEELELAKKELAEKKVALRLALEKKEKANEGKLAVEQELRTWRAENERRRKSSISQAAANAPRSPLRNVTEDAESKTEEGSPIYNRYSTSSSTGMQTPPETHHPEEKVKKKKSLFPRIVTLLARKKASGAS